MVTGREPAMPHRVVVDDKAQRATQIEVIQKCRDADRRAVSGERAIARAQVTEEHHEIIAKALDPI